MGKVAVLSPPPTHNIAKADSNGLTVGKFTFTSTGLDVEGDPTFNELSEAFRIATHIHTGSQWNIGDVLLKTDAKHGEKFSQMLEASNLSLQTLKISQYVASNFERFRRRNLLSFAHHFEVASLPIDQQDYWLDQAELNSWSKSQLRANLRATKKKDLLIASGEFIQPTATLESWERWLPGQPQCDLLLTDPPYRTDVPDIESFAAEWLPIALAKVKPTGRAYVFIGPYPDELIAYLKADHAGLRLCQVLVWTYRNTIGPCPSHDYKNNWQAILYFRGPLSDPLQWPTDKNGKPNPELNEAWTVQDVSAPDARHGTHFHEWQKPDEIAERFVRHSTKPGDIVLDPFCCTGTFLLAAGKYGRMAKGCDISSDNLEIAGRRGVEIQ